MAPNQTLLDLVPEGLKPLSPLEGKLIQAAHLGVMVSDFPEGPIDMAQIGDAQSVRSEILIWLLTTPGICKNIHYKGIHLRGAKIIGVLDLEYSDVECPLRLINCIVEEKMILDSGKYILLDLTGSQTGPIHADSIQVRCDVLFKDQFKAKGNVSLRGATIGESLDCSGGEFENPGGDALSGDCLTTKNDVSFSNGFKAKGDVRLLGANIGGDLACRGGEFENPGGDALSGDGLITKGAVFLDNGFKAKGKVRLLGANIGGYLDCSRGEFDNPDGRALGGALLTTKGAVNLKDGFKAKGEVRFPGATIGANLDCRRGEFDNAGGIALNVDNIRVSGSFIWRELTKKPIGILSLENANVANLDDDENSWPESGNLNIDGFVYGQMTSHVPADSKSRLRWLNLRDPNNLNRQPYEQLISVFRQMGLRDDARDVTIEKQRVLRKQLKGIHWLWSYFLDKTISYGYQTWKVLIIMGVIIVLGTFIFNRASQLGVMVPKASQQQLPSQNLVFEPFPYSLDVFLPIVDLHQESAWEPDPGLKYGNIFQYYMYFHILTGWLFTTLTVAAVTGLVRSD